MYFIIYSPYTMAFLHFPSVWIRGKYQKKKNVKITKTSKPGTNGQSALWYPSFCMWGFNQLQVKNIRKKFQKVPNKENLDLLHIPATIYMKFIDDSWPLDNQGVGGHRPSLPWKNPHIMFYSITIVQHLQMQPRMDCVILYYLLKTKQHISGPLQFNSSNPLFKGHLYFHSTY